MQSDDVPPWRFYIHGSMLQGIARPRQWWLAVGCAEGLAALHNCDPPIIHRDIKSTNVFVAADFTPKIADFDMAVQSYGPLTGRYGSLLTRLLPQPTRKRPNGPVSHGDVAQCRLPLVRLLGLVIVAKKRTFLRALLVRNLLDIPPPPSQNKPRGGGGGMKVVGSFSH